MYKNQTIIKKNKKEFKFYRYTNEDKSGYNMESYINKIRWQAYGFSLIWKQKPVVPSDGSWWAGYQPTAKFFLLLMIVQYICTRTRTRNQPPRMIHYTWLFFQPESFIKLMPSFCDVLQYFHKIWRLLETKISCYTNNFYHLSKRMGLVDRI